MSARPSEIASQGLVTSFAGREHLGAVLLRGRVEELERVEAELEQDEAAPARSRRRAAGTP